MTAGRPAAKEDWPSAAPAATLPSPPTLPAPAAALRCCGFATGALSVGAALSDDVAAGVGGGERRTLEKARRGREGTLRTEARADVTTACLSGCRLTACSSCATLLSSACGSFKGVAAAAAAAAASSSGRGVPPARETATGTPQHCKEGGEWGVERARGMHCTIRNTCHTIAVKWVPKMHCDAL
jgi:hypothetical protein